MDTKLRDLSECPPDCTLEYWITVLVESQYRSMECYFCGQQSPTNNPNKLNAAEVVNRLERLSKTIKGLELIEEESKSLELTDPQLYSYLKTGELRFIIGRLLKIARGK